MIKENQRRVFRFKTKKELLDSDWNQDSEGDFRHKDDAIFVLHSMEHLFGKVIQVTESLYDNTFKYNDKERETVWTITKDMISKELSPNEYPEYFI